MGEAPDLREVECPSGEACWWGCDIHELTPPEPGPCAACDKDPADGFASVWTAAEGERWYCHGDDGPSCYTAAPTPTPRADEAQERGRHE